MNHKNVITHNYVITTDHVYANSAQFSTRNFKAGSVVEFFITSDKLIELMLDLRYS